MKIIIEKSTRQVKYTFPDEAELDMRDNCIVCPDFIVGDLNICNSELITVENIPADFVGCKYLYIDGVYAVNPQYISPE